MKMENLNAYPVGTIVRLNAPLFGRMDGVKGIVVGHLKDEFTSKPRCSVLFENSLHDSFLVEEQDKFLNKVGFSDKFSGYNYFNDDQIEEDWKNGLFTDIF